MDEMRMTGSPSASQFARRTERQASPDAGISESDTAEKGKSQPPAQGQVEETGQDRRAQVEMAVKRLNEYVQSIQRGLKFDYDEEVSQTVITVVDRSTNEVVRQIPDEVALELARSLSADSTFSLLNVKA